MCNMGIKITIKHKGSGKSVPEMQWEVNLYG
jgi:hypothetical protein